ncbi:MAG: lysophospholipase [Deltaproteobacteria bacterium]|nr:lysophospholipase [Deltaproteobacteria bacterium]
MLQERLIFFPEKLDKNYKFSFKSAFEERFIRLKDGNHLHALLFKNKSPAGLIFYLHGNAGSLASWGYVADVYLEYNYDVFIPDYRGYGKSDGRIESESQFYEDIQTAYDEIKKEYPEDRIVVLGYSIGTGPAARLASENNPRLLILQAPYYSLTDLAKRLFPFIPSALLKYRFETYRYLRMCRMPVVIFHGDRDEVIYYGSSLKLQKEFKESDRLIILKGEYHNGITDNPEYKKELSRILSELNT